MLCNPGKTAPRLLEDLLNYDPRAEHILQRNILTSSPSQESKGSSAPVPSKDSCRHTFVSKLDVDEILPGTDTRPGPTCVYELHAICRKCRHHLDLNIDYRGAEQLSSSGQFEFFACPNKEYPLHHFQFISKEKTTLDDTVYNFRCSAPQCLAKLRVSLRPPRFPDESIRLLSDPQLLQARVDKAKKEDPDRPDLEAAQAGSCYELLLVFLTHAMDMDRERKTIKLGNRRFMLTFGGDCDSLLKNLGFELVQEEEGPAWALPDASRSKHPELFLQYLNDVRNELVALYFDMSDRERALLKRVPHSPINPSSPPRSMLNDISRCLGYVTYDKAPFARRTIDLTDDSDS